MHSLILIEEDRLADDLGWCLARYWCGEGVSCGHIVLMAAFDDVLPGLDKADNSQALDDGCTVEEMEQFKMSLPRNLHLDKFRSRKDKEVGSNEESVVREPIAIIEELDIF